MSIIIQTCEFISAKFYHSQTFVYHSVSFQNSCDRMTTANRPAHIEWIVACWCLCLTWYFRRHGFTSTKYLLMMMVLDNNEKKNRWRWKKRMATVWRRLFRHRLSHSVRSRKQKTNETKVKQTSMIHCVSLGSGFECRMYGVCATAEVWCCHRLNPTSYHPKTSLRKIAMKNINRWIWKNFNGCD